MKLTKKQKKDLSDLLSRGLDVSEALDIVLREVVHQKKPSHVFTDAERRKGQETIAQNKLERAASRASQPQLQTLPKPASARPSKSQQFEHSGQFLIISHERRSRLIDAIKLLPPVWRRDQLENMLKAQGQKPGHVASSLPILRDQGDIEVVEELPGRSLFYRISATPGRNKIMTKDEWEFFRMERATRPPV